MAHALTFSAEVHLVFRCWLNAERNAFHNAQAVSSNAAIFGWVIGHKTKFASTEVGKNLCANSVFATVNRESKFGVGVNCVKALVLQ